MLSAPTVVIADGDRLVRQMLVSMCGQMGIGVAGAAETIQELELVCSDVRPDVVVAADQFGDAPLEGVLPGLLEGGARVIVLVAGPSPERVTALLDEEISGCYCHDAAPEEVVAGIMLVARGSIALGPKVAGTVLHQWRRLRARPATVGLRRAPNLTGRELEVLTAMADGLSAKAIALRLGVALKTVENHKVRVFDKLGVQTQAHAVSVAIGLGVTRAFAVGPSGDDSNGRDFA